MSYILNALRKSEQERQAQQPETITDQVLTPPQKSRKTALLVGGLLAVNLLLAALVVWYLNKTDDAPAKPQATAQTVQEKAVSTPLPVAEETEDDESDSEQQAEEDEFSEAEMPAQEAMRPPMPAASAPTTKAPSIEELASARQVEEQKAAKRSQEDKQVTAGRRGQRAAAIGQREQLRKDIQARRAQRMSTVESESNVEIESDATTEKKPDAVSAPAASQEIPLFKELPYDFRSSAPKLSINVFKYDPKSEDSFVVLNMTKYKAGQTTKDAVEIKEIRPDSVVASYGGRVFRIERP